MTSTLDRPSADATMTSPASEADRALDVLQTTHRTALGLLDSRWSDARVALAAGADVARVAEAMDLTTPQVVDGMRAWVDDAVRDGLLDRYAGARARKQVSAWTTAPSAGDSRTSAGGPDQPGWSDPDLWGRPRCLPGCTTTYVYDHVCTADVGKVPIDPVWVGEARSMWVELEQGPWGRRVLFAEQSDPVVEVDEDGVEHGIGGQRHGSVALAVDTIPELVALLLSAHRTARTAR